MSGKIITIEGLDGAGKSTQIKLLTEHLDQVGQRYRFVHFPIMDEGYYGQLIAEYLRGEFGSLEQVHPKLVALLFAENRHEHRAQLMEWIEQGYLVLLDRYVHSNIAFQCAKLDDPQIKKQLKEWILDFEFGHNHLPAPSLSLFLQVPFEFIAKSLNTTRTGQDRDYLQGKADIHESSLDFQRKVYEEYQALLKEQVNFYPIPCATPDGQWQKPEEIHSQIVDKIENMSQA